MVTPRRIAAIVLAAGSGSRAGGSIAKQFRPLGDKPVLLHALQAFKSHPAIADVLVVTSLDAIEEVRQLAKGTTCVEGGATRRGSVRNGLEWLAASVTPPDAVLIHDSARPLLPARVIDRLVEALASGAAGAMPVLPVADTLVESKGDRAGDVVERTPLRKVQTPQAFDFQTILAAHLGWDGALEPTDDAQMVRAGGGDVVLVEGDACLEKITYAGDHERMEMLMGAVMHSRTGLGFDVHRLVEGEALWLCGVQVPHSHGLSGHSDADVAIHALVDALMGALAEGDIGSHFPPSDAKWRGASSDRFLSFAAERVRERGGVIEHVDITIICEAPKIGPHREDMRARLAEILALPVARVSVKATTTERLGLTGRGEGIAAQAVATVRLPAED